MGWVETRACSVGNTFAGELQLRTALAILVHTCVSARVGFADAEVRVWTKLRPSPHVALLFGVCTDATDGVVRLITELAKSRLPSYLRLGDGGTVRC